jgi:hypothetical protein
MSKTIRLWYLWLVSVILMTACGGGGGDSGNGNTPLASTTTISSNMSSEYSIDQITSAEVIALVQSLAAQGFGCSSTELVDVANLKETHVQTFLNAVIANIQFVKSNSSIDKTAITGLFATYQAEDVAWISSSSLASTLNCGYSAAAISATGYVTTINSYYANAIAQLNAM